MGTDSIAINMPPYLRNPAEGEDAHRVDTKAALGDLLGLLNVLRQDSLWAFHMIRVPNDQLKVPRLR